jgi:hypothetical protein
VGRSLRASGPSDVTCPWPANRDAPTGGDAVERGSAVNAPAAAGVVQEEPVLGLVVLRTARGVGEEAMAPVRIPCGVPS